MSSAIQGFCLCPNVEATKSLKRTWINLIISFSLLRTRLGVVSVDLPSNSRHASDGVPLDFLFELPQPSALLLKLPAASLAAV